METTIKMIKALVEEKKYLDVGRGFAEEHDLTSTRLALALANLKRDGYKTHYVDVMSRSNSHISGTVKIFTKDDVSFEDVVEHVTCRGTSKK